MLSRFKLTAMLFAVAVLAIAQPACATATPPPAAPPSSSDSSAVSQQSQEQRQQQGQAQQQTGGTLSDSSSSRFNAYALPAPVFTPPMAKVDCPTPRIENRAVSIGWGFVSAARGDTTTDDCTLLALRNAYVEQCQYASAKQVQDLLTARHLAGFKASDVVYLDLTAKECALLKLPPLPPAPVQLFVPPPELPKSKPPAAVKKKRKPVQCTLPQKTGATGVECGTAPWNPSKRST